MEYRKTREIAWIKAARKAFDEFPKDARERCATALTIAAEGGKADIAKPMRDFGSGVFEIALPFRGDAYRVVYAVEIVSELWVVHAFQKKSKKDIKTPQRDVDLIRQRLKGLKESL